MVDRFLKDVYSLIRELAPKTILDIGCGEGFVDQYLLQNSPQWQICGVDISEKNLKLAKKRTPEIDTLHSDAYRLPFKNDRAV